MFKTFLKSALENPKGAQNLIDEVEKAILERSKNAEAFAKYNSSKERKYPYYRIRVKNFLIFYVVIPEEKENQLRKLLTEIANDNKIEKTDKEFLQEQINSIIGIGGR